MQCFLQRHQNIGFHISAAFRGCFAAAESTESRTATTAAEKRFKEIAESGPVEFKLDAAAIAARLIKSTAGLTAPLRRRLKSARLVPIGAELIVLLALFRIAQDFVGFVDLLKFFFGRFLVLGDVGMIFARQFPERAFDFVIRRGLRNTERFIIVPELHSHRRLNLVPPISSRNLLQTCTTWGNF